jgi:S-adenosyl methyltransferase
VNDLGWVPAGIDINDVSPARVHDYYLGGWHNFPADRWAAERAIDRQPTIPAIVFANRRFLQRAVRYLAAAGVRQFLDLGSGIPTAGHVHEIAHAVDPQARVVYVDVDPVAVAHGTALLAGLDTAAMLGGDLRDVPLVLAAAPVRELFDFSQPIGVLTVAVLDLLPDADDPAGVVRRYRDAVSAGSHLVLSHRLPPPDPEADAVRDRGPTPGTPRTQDEISALFDGWDLVEPGVTDVARWHPAAADTLPADSDPAGYAGGVARKP